jgi:GABA(A) receptor-associated protein
MFFKESYDESQRLKESKRIMEKYPDRIPIICDCDPSSKWTITHRKYLVPKTHTVSDFVFVIRKRMSLKESEAIYILINDRVIPPSSSSMSKLYADYKDPDGFLYITICKESAFG